MLDRGRAVTLVSLAVALSAAAFVACDGTQGAPASVHVVLGGSPATFTTSTGWTVTLTDAHAAIGPIYVYAPPGDMTVQLERALLPVALAHSGYDPLSGMPVRIEWLEQAAVDLLAPPAEVGIAMGTVGMTNGVEILLNPPDASIMGPVHGHTLWVAGTAVSGTQTVHFEGGLDIPLLSPISRAIEGVGLDALVADGGTLTVNVLVAQWLDQAHFDLLTTTAADGNLVIDTDTQPYDAWFLGARSAAAFTASYQAPTP